MMGTTQLALIAAIAALGITVVARFDLLCLRDLASTADADLRYLTRTGWAAAIILAIPMGGIAYLSYGRSR